MSPFIFHSRIYEILPQRIQQWQQSPCIAEEHGKKQLERIRREQQNARLRLTDMERRFHELEGIIAKAKQQAVQQDEEVNSQAHSILVASCGFSVGLADVRNALSITERKPFHLLAGERR